MNIDLDRLCMLAGVKSNEGKLMREGADHDAHEGADYDAHEGEGHIEEESHDLEEEALHPDLEEMIEIDEQMLVQELRRAKRIMNESKRTAARREKNIFEAELKTIIESEVENVMKDLNLNSGWVYGDRKPQASRRGFSHQGSYLKGLGFK